MPEHEHDCSQFLHLVSDFIDDNLDDLTCQEFKKHLDECEHCRIVVDTTKKTIDLYHTSNEEIELPTEVRGRLFHCLELDEYLEK